MPRGAANIWIRYLGKVPRQVDRRDGWWMEGQWCTVRSVRCDTVCTVSGLPSPPPLSSPAGRPPHCAFWRFDLVSHSQHSASHAFCAILLINSERIQIQHGDLFWSWLHLLLIYHSVLHPIRNHILYQAVISIYVPALHPIEYKVTQQNIAPAVSWSRFAVDENSLVLALVLHPVLER